MKNRTQMNSKDIKISVIIPTYNRENTIQRAIKSVLYQTYSKLEVLVIDDGSTDSTEEIVRTIEDYRVRYISLEKNQKKRFRLMKMMMKLLANFY